MKQWFNPLKLIIVVSVIVSGGCGMADSQTLFTAVEGVVTENGEPIAGVRLSQTAKLGANDTETQSATTDTVGQFSFPAIVVEKGAGGFLPQQFAVGQEIVIDYKDKEYVGWVLTKFEPEAGAEVGSDPIRLVCDLENDQSGGEKHVGICPMGAG